MIELGVDKGDAEALSSLEVWLVASWESHALVLEMVHILHGVFW